MPKKNKPYRTPTACYKVVPVRRENDIEKAFRIHNAESDRRREADMHKPHTGPITQLIDRSK